MLFLDDERNPQDVTWITMHEGPWDIVRTQMDFQTYVLQNGIPDIVSFDNDLGDGQGEGVFCVNWLIDQVLDGVVSWNENFRFTVHSKNGEAAKAISSKLSQFIQFMKDR